MDDIRKIKYGNRLKRRANMSTFLGFFKKNWFKILIISIIISLIFFPQFTGNVVGDWLNKLVTSFLQNLTF